MDQETLFLFLIVGGVICVVAAIIGGGLSLHVVSIPVMSPARQVILAIFGAVIAYIGYYNFTKESSDDAGRSTEQDAPAVADAPRNSTSFTAA